jgi:hypothetical protein
MQASAAASVSAEASLLCPFTQDHFVDPITLYACCGKSVSRAPLIEWLRTHDHCFLCNKSLLGIFDPAKAARSVELGHLADEARAREQGANHEEEEEKKKNDGGGGDASSPWKAKLVRLSKRNEPWIKSTVGRLTITHAGQANGSFRTQLVPCLDKSGSMETEIAPGKTVIAQAQFAMRSIIDAVYAYPSLETTLVAYDNRAVSQRVDKRNNQAAIYYEWVARLSDRMGGTNFQAAFDELLRVADAAMPDEHVTSLVFIVLTDGDDIAVKTAEQRAALVSRFKADLARRWNRKVGGTCAARLHRVRRFAPCACPISPFHPASYIIGCSSSPDNLGRERENECSLWMILLLLCM